MGLESEFYHKDEFEKVFASKFGYRFDYPIILAQSNKGLEVLISPDELKNIDSVQELIFKVRNSI